MVTVWAPALEPALGEVGAALTGGLVEVAELGAVGLAADRPCRRRRSGARGLRRRSGARTRAPRRCPRARSSVALVGLTARGSRPRGRRPRRRARAPRSPSTIRTGKASARAWEVPSCSRLAEERDHGDGAASSEAILADEHFLGLVAPSHAPEPSARVWSSSPRTRTATPEPRPPNLRPDLSPTRRRRRPSPRWLIEARTACEDAFSRGERRAWRRQRSSSWACRGTSALEGGAKRGLGENVHCRAVVAR